jgi:hypothetical protein
VITFAGWNNEHRFCDMYYLHIRGNFGNNTDNSENNNDGNNNSENNNDSSENNHQNNNSENNNENIHKYDFCWERIHYSFENDEEDFPLPVCDHAAVLVQDNLYVFGGSGLFNFETHELEHYNFLYKYNVKTKKWKKFRPSEVKGTPPEPRQAPGMTVLRQRCTYIL